MGVTDSRNELITFRAVSGGRAGGGVSSQGRVYKGADSVLGT